MLLLWVVLSLAVLGLSWSRDLPLYPLHRRALSSLLEAPVEDKAGGREQPGHFQGVGAGAYCIKEETDQSNYCFLK